jgi:hypothetical protein
MNPYVFLVGCPRSGTTLLRRIGDAHPELAIVREQHWLPRYWERRIGITSEGIVTSDLLDRLLADRRFLAMEIPLEQVLKLIEKNSSKHYAQFVRELFDLYGQVKGKRLVGEKTPGYVRHLATLNELWPQTKVVHMIRDGRDVALSLLEWSKAVRNVGRFPTWEQDPVTTAALFWEWNVRLGREVGRPLGPDRYHELRYEALVAHPELECRKLCDFLTLPYDPAMLRFHEGRANSRPGLSAKKAWRPVTAGLRKWEKQMEPSAVRRLEAASGPFLDELRYARGVESASEDEVERAGRLRRDFAGGAYSRRWAVPEAWMRVNA